MNTDALAPVRAAGAQETAGGGKEASAQKTPYAGAEKPLKPKVVVYAIAKDESGFAERWMASMSEADEIVVMDTGSTDDTAEKLARLGARVEVRRITPWRFDVARNESMKLCPEDADILVCTDLDEYFVPGWRAKLDRAWAEARDRGAGATTFTYEYVWNFNGDGSDGAKFTYEKIHKPGVCVWEHPVHEVLAYRTAKVCVPVPGMRLEHHADPTKSRGQYLALLEMSVREAPTDDRNMHYLGREYMFYGRWQEAIATLKRHLSMPNAVWRPERASSMRFIARCCGALGRKTEQEVWLWRAVTEAKEQREACLELAELAYEKKDWSMLVRACEECLARTERVMSYLTEARAWGARPWDLYSIGLWYTGRRGEALEANRTAMELDPDDRRLQDNDALMRRIMEGAGDGR